MMFSIFFFVSGFCGLLYQIVWLRLAMGAFGVIAPVLSTVLSVFMLGLGGGSWAAGRWLSTERARGWTSSRLLAWYGGCEGIAALGALSVPGIFALFNNRLAGEMNGIAYLAGSAATIAGALIIPCLALGATTPIVLAYGRARGWNTTRGFSALYIANLFGALSGALLTPFVLIERLGFHSTLVGGVLLQGLVSICALVFSARTTAAVPPIDGTDVPEHTRVDGFAHCALTALFLTGFVAMACEVLWTRLFTPVLGTTIYAFAGILAVYLATHAAGVGLYRRYGWRMSARITALILGVLPIAALLPLFLNDARWPLSPLRALGSLALFCALLGGLTPGWVDAYSQGDPQRAGRAYAVNVLGCVLGPLAAGYLLLPFFGVQAGLLGLAALLAGFAGWTMRTRVPRQVLLQSALGVGAIVAALTCHSLEVPANLTTYEIRRDYAATVVSFGDGLRKRLMVNGINLTNLTPDTKMMADMPVLMHQGQPRRALMICFGMGTTFRSLMSWNLETTAVELVPSVRDAFGYYFADAEAVRRRPEGRIVIDDGRRFLSRTADRYDIITLDPPPPVESAASGFLYSREFYDQLKRHLAPGGVVQQWWPGGEARILQSVARTFLDAFPYVCVYKGVNGIGFHFFGSLTPLRPLGENDLARMPPQVQRDMMEWFPGTPAALLWHDALKENIPPSMLLNPYIPALTDDRPFNEYFLLRRWRERRRGTYLDAY